MIWDAISFIKQIVTHECVMHYWTVFTESNGVTQAMWQQQPPTQQLQSCLSWVTGRRRESWVTHNAIWGWRAADETFDLSLFPMWSLMGLCAGDGRRSWGEKRHTVSRHSSPTHNCALTLCILCLPERYRKFIKLEKIKCGFVATDILPCILG